MLMRAERAARIIGVLALVLALVLSLWPGASDRVTDDIALRIDSVHASADSVVRTLREGIVRWSATHAQRDETSASSDARRNDWPGIALMATVVPNAEIRALLSAARTAGVPVQWQDSTALRDVAIDASDIPGPRGDVLLAAMAQTVSDSGRASLVLRDAGGTLDSVTMSPPSLRIRAAQWRDPLSLTVRSAAPSVGNGATHTNANRIVAVATARHTERAPVGRVLVHAKPGWEAKFVTAALEETGWHVDGTLNVSPTANVRVGTPGALDSARYAVAIVLDSGVVSANTLRRFIAQGGGVVLSGDALRDVSLRALAEVRTEDERPPVAGALLTDQPKRGLAAFHLVAPSQSIVLEHEGADPTVLVERRGVGRILVSGYRTTWRWRMEGSDDGADAHRRWWSALTSAVALSTDTLSANTMSSPMRTNAGGASWPGDAAPVADLKARLGPSDSTRATPLTASTSWRPSLWLLYLVASVALLAEWALRRMRGAR